MKAEAPSHDEAISRNWRRDRRLSVSEWADAHRVLDPLFTNEAGPWRTSRVPHAREWMDSASCPWVRQLTLLASTQVGKSETLNNVAGFFIHHRPSPAMFVLPSDDRAKEVCERRILPMIEASPALTAELTGRAHDTRTKSITFRRSVLYFRGAQSPAGLASVALRLVLCDETEKWPLRSGDESSPLGLLRERTRTFYDHLIVVASTPKVRGGIIDREFAAGDQRRFHVPCPHCGKHQVLKWSQVKWDSAAITTSKEMKARREATYECEHCRGQINDAQKLAMCALGVWVPAAFTLEQWLGGERDRDREPHRSYHIWAAYSPWLAWWELVEAFLKCREEDDLQRWVNSWLGELWEDRVTDTTDAAVRACLEPRMAGTMPEATLRMITAAVDVQHDRLEWCVQGWGDDEESWVLNAGRIPLMADRADWRALGDVLFRTAWGKLPLARVVLDSRGGRGDEVVDFCRLWQPVAVPIAGVESDGPEQFSPKKIDRHPRTGLPLPQAMVLWTVRVVWFKDLVAGRLARALVKDEDGETPRAGLVHLPSGLPDGWLDQVASEHKVRERSGNGRIVDRWVLKPGHRRNEAWDLLVYNAAAARMRLSNLFVSADRLPEHLQRKPAPPPTPRKRPPSSQRYPGFGGRR